MPRAALILLVLLAPACASFDPLDLDGDPAPVPIETNERELPLREEIRYVGTWNGLPAGRGSFLFERSSGEIRAEATAATSGLVSLIYGVGVSAHGVLGAEDGRTRVWSYETDGGDPEKRIVTRFDPATGDIVAFVRKGEELEERRLTAPAALDPFAAVLALRRAALAPGDSFRIEVFTEWWVYQVDVLVGEPERVRTPAGFIEGIRVRADIRKVRDGVPEEKSNGAAIWITPDADRVPVLIEADAALGRIALKLTDYTKGWPRITSGRGTRPE